MTRRALIAVFASTLIVFLVASLPMSIIGWASIPVSYSRAEGTLWNGALRDVTWQGQSLGDAHIIFRPAALLLGRLSFALDIQGRGPLTGHGVITRGFGGSIAIRDASFWADVARMPTLLPLSGFVAVDIKSLKLDRNGCHEAIARVETNTLQRGPGGLNWTGPVLSGQAQCEDGSLVLPLTGAQGPDRIAVTFIADRGSAYTVDITVETPDPAVMSALSALGFTPAGGGFTLRQTGRWG